MRMAILALAVMASQVCSADWQLQGTKLTDGNWDFTVRNNQKVATGVVGTIVATWNAGTGVLDLSEVKADTGLEIVQLGDFLFNGDANQPSSHPDAAAGITGLVGCESLCVVRNYTFNCCTNMQSVDLSMCTALRQIGKFAFSSNITLRTFRAPSGLTTIGESAFRYSSALTDFSPLLPESVGSVGQYAFNGTKVDGKLTLHSAVRTVSQYAFSGTSITELELNESLTDIAKFAFASCKCLTTLTKPFPSTLKTLGIRAFDQDTVLSGVLDFSACTELTDLGDNMTFRQTAVEEVRLPPGLTGLGKWTFQGCTALTNVVATVPTGALRKTMRKTAGSMGGEVFRDCSNLVKVQLPWGGKTRIDNANSGPFIGCTKLVRVDLWGDVVEQDEGTSKFLQNVEKDMVTMYVPRGGDYTASWTKLATPLTDAEKKTHSEAFGSYTAGRKGFLAWSKESPYLSAALCIIIR